MTRSLVFASIAIFSSATHAQLKTCQEAAQSDIRQCRELAAVTLKAAESETDLETDQLGTQELGRTLQQRTSGNAIAWENLESKCNENLSDCHRNCNLTDPSVVAEAKRVKQECTKAIGGILQQALLAKESNAAVAVQSASSADFAQQETKAEHYSDYVVPAKSDVKIGAINVSPMHACMELDYQASRLSADQYLSLRQSLGCR